MVVAIDQRQVALPDQLVPFTHQAFFVLLCRFPALTKAPKGLAMQISSGDLLIYTDYQNVVKGFQELQRNNWDLRSMAKWDNFDLWFQICKEFQFLPRSISVQKVAAHGRDPFQHEFLNSGNQIADELAKSLARAKFEQASDDGFRQIRDLVLIQLHLVRDC